MADDRQINPGAFTEITQKFLFACAFWAVASDEQLKLGEQRWLNDRFGERKTKAWLDEMIAAEGNRFFQLFDKLAASLADSDKRRIYPGLIAWLSSCVESDGPAGTSEKVVILRIKERLSLEAELVRLARQTQATPARVGEARPPPVRGSEAKPPVGGSVAKAPPPVQKAASIPVRQALPPAKTAAVQAGEMAPIRRFPNTNTIA